METKKTSMTSRLKLTGICQHLFLTEKRIDYILLLSDKPTLILYSLQEHQFTYIAQTEVHAGKPISLFLDGNDNIILLHASGICVWSVTEIIEGSSPQRRDIKWPSNPIKLIPLGTDEYVVVCANNLLSFLAKQGGHRDVGYEGQFMMERALHKNLITTEDCLYVLVPSQSCRYPYLFTRGQVRGWEKAGFLIRYSNACKKYYIDDENLPQKEYCVNFCPQRKLIYICLSQELRILQWRQHSEVGIVMSMSMRLKARWNETPLFCSINVRNGGLAFAEIKKVGRMQPLEYEHIRKALKQSSDGSINFVYFSGETLVMLSLHGPEKNCKLYFLPPQEIV